MLNYFKKSSPAPIILEEAEQIIKIFLQNTKKVNVLKYK